MYEVGELKCTRLELIREYKGLQVVLNHNYQPNHDGYICYIAMAGIIWFVFPGATVADAIRNALQWFALETAEDRRLSREQGGR